MKTIILTIPKSKENWFSTLFKQFRVNHKILDEEEDEELGLARLIDEAMAEEGEVPRKKVYQFVEKHGG